MMFHISWAISYPSKDAYYINIYAPSPSVISSHSERYNLHFSYSILFFSIVVGVTHRWRSNFRVITMLSRLLSYRRSVLGSIREFAIRLSLFFSSSFLSCGNCASSIELSKIHILYY